MKNSHYLSWEDQKTTANPGLVAFSLIVTCWLLANYRTVQWLWQSLERGSRFQAGTAVVLGLGFAAWLFYRHNHRPKLPLMTPLHLHSVPLLLIVGSSILAFGFSWLFDLPQLTALLFGMGSYGVIGLIGQPQIWQRGLPIALLISALLPFSTEFGTGLGFPARVLTAQMVEHLLSLWQVTAISSHDIILLENGVAHVDIPCSGLKSLWTGTLFLLIVTWLERRPLSLRWILVWGANLGFLISANIFRVLVLVVLTYVFQQPQIADILHVPLGLLGFITACGLSWWILQWVLPIGQATPGGRPWALPSKRNLVLLLAAIVVLGQLPQLVLPQPAAATSPLIWPTSVQTQTLPLTEAEKDLFESRGAFIAEKYHFSSSDNIQGSILIVGGQALSTFHAPELCFVGNGLSVNHMEKRELAPNLPVRWLALQNGQLAATYWFQSPRTTTDNFLTRLKRQTLDHDRRWILVSILFDAPYSPDDPHIKTFVSSIQQTVSIALQEGQS